MENDASDAKTRSGRRCSVRDASGNNSTYFEITDGLSFGLWNTPPILSAVSGSLVRQIFALSTYIVTILQSCALAQPKGAVVSVAVAARRLPQPCTNCNLATATLSKNKPGLHMRTHACWGLNPLGRGARRYPSPFPRVPLSLFPRPPTSGIVGHAGPMTSEGKSFSGPPKPSKDRGSPLLLGLTAK
jgi:hypothetical protein